MAFFHARPEVSCKQLQLSSFIRCGAHTVHIQYSEGSDRRQTEVHLDSVDQGGERLEGLNDPWMTSPSRIMWQPTSALRIAVERQID